MANYATDKHTDVTYSWKPKPRPSIWSGAYWRGRVYRTRRWDLAVRVWWTMVGAVVAKLIQS